MLVASSCVDQRALLHGVEQESLDDAAAALESAVTETLILAFFILVA